MRISQATKTLKAALQADLSVMMWGGPGIGKSSIVHQLGREEGIPVLDVRLSQLDPVDLRGVPFIDDGYTRWATASFLPNVKVHGPRGILFLDEINSAAQATQAASYQLVLDRRLGEYVLDDGWRIVAAGNNESDRALVNKMASPLRNRFLHIDVETHPDDFREYGFRNNINEEVLGFIAFNSKCLNMFEDVKERNKKAFATPRSWEFVSRVMGTGMDNETEMYAISGLVGDGPAAEFSGYLKYHRDLPDIDALIKHPDKAKIPTEPASLYALTTSLAMRADKKNFPNIMKFIQRLKQVEFQVMTVKSSIMKNPSVGDTPEFTEWSIKNADAMS